MQVMLRFALVAFALAGCTKATNQEGRQPTGEQPTTGAPGASPNVTKVAVPGGETEGKIGRAHV